MPGTPTTKYAIPTLASTDAVTNAPTQLNSALSTIDGAMAGYAEGTFAGRPAAGKTGRIYRCTDTLTVYIDNGSSWDPIGSAPGDIKASAVAAAPSGWLLCDGSPASRTGATAALFAAISTVYGVGDGSTTFNLPDLRGRVPVGVDGVAGRLGSNDALGNSSGAETRTLTAAQLPTDVWRTGTQKSVNATPGTTNTDAGNAGGGQPLNIMQPYQIVNWMIKT